ncbi:MAG: hypothetical protein R3330_18895, partial [Saprospiraceae bacterium]|nr:hypothetical protein [Saprospiraceae bacterium]
TVSISVDNAAVCVGGSVLLSSTVLNGSGQFVFQWQESPNNLAWANVDTATNATFYPPTGTAGTTYYRLIVTDSLSGCSDPISGSLSVTVYDDAQVSINVDNPVVCVDGQALLTATLVGGSPSATYQWQQSVDSASWFDIALATSNTFNAPTTSAGVTYYRVVISDTLEGCSDPVSAGIRVTVLDDASVTINLNNAEVCIGGDATIMATVTNGSTAIGYQWQSSLDNSTWFDMAGQNGSTLVAPTSSAGTTYYRVAVTDSLSGCFDPVSSSVSVTVVPDASVNVTVDNAEVCVDGDVGLTANITGGSSALQIQWQSSPDDAAWTNIPGATDTTYTADTGTPGMTYYRAVITDTLSD